MTDTRAADLLARRRRVSPRWLSLYYDEPVELVEGDGRRVRDGDGRSYLDFFGGILTTMTGHAVPEVVEAIREQAGRLLHSSTLYLSEPLIALSERIAELSDIPDAKVFLVNSGTEANDVALQLACGVRRSNQVIALRGSYHGRSFATMGVTGIRAWSPQALTPLAVHYVHGGYRYRSPFGHLDDAAYTRACADDLRDVLETATSGDVACLIAEPVQGVGGFATPPDGFFTPMAEIARDYGLLWISDEVQTGWGRTGTHRWGWQAHPGLAPDLVTFAKGLGNGLAIGGVVGRGEVIDAVAGNSISTFGGNPLAAAGALANLEVLVRDDLQGNALARGRQMRAALDPLVDKLACVGEVRGRGLMVGVELVAPGTRDAAPDLAAAVMEATRHRGLLVGRGGLRGNVLRIAPPLSVTAAEVDEGTAILVDALAEVDASAAGAAAHR
ncbi:MAG TPA: aspartate aminotransferase family protein [Acidimicrobiales bacterium]|nr:aspartate aminotransferase family protein [Acidimicrobiales bacterium]